MQVHAVHGTNASNELFFVYLMLVELREHRMATAFTTFFKLADKTGDASLDVAELHTIFSLAFPTSTNVTEVVEILLRELDRDADGQISHAELRRVACQRNAGRWKAILLELPRRLSPRVTSYSKALLARAATGKALLGRAGGALPVHVSHRPVGGGASGKAKFTPVPPHSPVHARVAPPPRQDDAPPVRAHPHTVLLPPIGEQGAVAPRPNEPEESA